MGANTKTMAYFGQARVLEGTVMEALAPSNITGTVLAHVRDHQPRRQQHG